MQSFFDYEASNNAVLQKLRSQPTAYTNFLLESSRRKSVLFLPQNVAVEGIDITLEFLYLHSAEFNPENPSQFITFGGVHGLFSGDRQFLHVIARPQDPSLYIKNCQPLFQEAQSIFSGYKPSPESTPIVVLREGVVDITGQSLPVVLIAEPFFLTLRESQEDIERRFDFNSDKSEEDEIRSSLSPQLLSSGVSKMGERRTVESSSMPGSMVMDHLAPRLNGESQDSPKGTHKRSHSTGKFPDLGPEVPPRVTEPMAQSQPNVSSVMQGVTIGGASKMGKNMSMPAVSANQNRSTKFIELINRREAKEIANNIRKFIRKFSTQPPIPSEHEQVVKRFREAAEEQIWKHPLWKGQYNEEMDATQDALEKLVTSKLYTHLFCPSKEDKLKDVVLETKMRKLARFLTFAHLDIHERFRNQASIDKAQIELKKMNSFKSPRDKMVCTMNCCKVIYSMMNAATSTDNADAAGADDFLPLLIYTVVHSGIDNLHSNIQFVRRYRHPDRMMTEPGYYFTNFESAVSFIENATAKCFSIDPAEYQRYMDTIPSSHPTQSSNTSSSSSDTVGRRRSLMPATMSPTPSLEQYERFAQIDNVDDLTIGDVRELLKAFKELYADMQQLNDPDEDMKETEGMSGSASAPDFSALIPRRASTHSSTNGSGRNCGSTTDLLS